jgi:sialic acid synthase SpsE
MMPVVITRGRLSLKSMDEIVVFFSKQSIPLAINHCVSVDPAEDSELEINEIDFYGTAIQTIRSAIRRLTTRTRLIRW